MSTVSLIEEYQNYYKNKMENREKENRCFYEYVRRQMKYRKKYSNETFGMICRISYQLGEPLENWIINKENL